jgi:hypothetical protein
VLLPQLLMLNILEGADLVHNGPGLVLELLAITHILSVPSCCLAATASSTWNSNQQHQQPQYQQRGLLQECHLEDREGGKEQVGKYGYMALYYALQHAFHYALRYKFCNSLHYAFILFFLSLKL